uniref:Uncharacterized protein n=1 Tax=Rhizophora mucronata TaxID=61149 RepID=A0A2P2PJE1_RHIMU
MIWASQRFNICTVWKPSSKFSEHFNAMQHLKIGAKHHSRERGATGCFGHLFV